ncbi:mitochondrial escape protein 2, partial [Cladochytrium tenue]
MRAASRGLASLAHLRNLAISSSSSLAPTAGPTNDSVASTMRSLATAFSASSSRASARTSLAARSSASSAVASTVAAVRLAESPATAAAATAVRLRRWATTAGAAVPAEYSTVADSPSSDASGPVPPPPPTTTHAVWFDNVFPVKLSRWDPRHYWAKRYASQMKTAARATLVPPASAFPAASDTNDSGGGAGGGFEYLGSTASIKEGGLLVRFAYAAGRDVGEVFETVRRHVEEAGVRSSFNLRKINAFAVQGTPFIEDLGSSIPSSRVRVEFSGGADLTVEELYGEFRQFGKIEDITMQPASKDAPSYGHVQFTQIRSATSAR